MHIYDTETFTEAWVYVCTTHIYVSYKCTSTTQRPSQKPEYMYVLRTYMSRTNAHLRHRDLHRSLSICMYYEHICLVQMHIYDAETFTEAWVYVCTTNICVSYKYVYLPTLGCMFKHMCLVQMHIYDTEPLQKPEYMYVLQTYVSRTNAHLRHTNLHRSLSTCMYYKYKSRTNRPSRQTDQHKNPWYSSYETLTTKRPTQKPMTTKNIQKYTINSKILPCCVYCVHV